MRFCLDTEFVERDAQIDLISIGVVGEDGREYYAVRREFNTGRARLHAFVGRHVWPHLPRKTVEQGSARHDLIDHDHPNVKPGKQIAEELAAFLLEPPGPVELWAWMSAYDHVAWTGLYGSMVDLPDDLPWITRDIEDYRIRLGHPELPAQDPATQHHALWDARHHWTQLRFLEQLERGRFGHSFVVPDEQPDGAVS